MTQAQDDAPEAIRGEFRQLRTRPKTAKDFRDRAGKFLRTHPSEDLETALKALQIAVGSFEEVAEHHE